MSNGWDIVDSEADQTGKKGVDLALAVIRFKKGDLEAHARQITDNVSQLRRMAG